MIEKPPFSLDALEPHISKKAMEVHFEKHHKGYANKLLKLIQGTEFKKMSVLEILEKVSWVHGPESHQVASSDTRLESYRRDMKIYNNAAQVWNHNFYWKCLSPNGGGEPTEPLKGLLEKSFGSMKRFREKFADASSGQFGSGWVWLWVTKDDEIKLDSYDNAITPASFEYPNIDSILLTMDVWEHAYYLDFLNERAKFTETFLDHLVNWKFVNERLEEVL